MATCTNVSNHDTAWTCFSNGFWRCTVSEACYYCTDVELADDFHWRRYIAIRGVVGRADWLDLEADKSLMLLGRIFGRSINYWLPVKLPKRNNSVAQRPKSVRVSCCMRNWETC